MHPGGEGGPGRAALAGGEARGSPPQPRTCPPRRQWEGPSVLRTRKTAENLRDACLLCVASQSGWRSRSRSARRCCARPTGSWRHCSRGGAAPPPRTRPALVPAARATEPRRSRHATCPARAPLARSPAQAAVAHAPRSAGRSIRDKSVEATPTGRRGSLRVKSFHQDKASCCHGLPPPHLSTTRHLHDPPPPPPARPPG